MGAAGEMVVGNQKFMLAILSWILDIKKGLLRGQLDSKCGTLGKIRVSCKIWELQVY